MRVMRKIRRSGRCPDCGSRKKTFDLHGVERCGECMRPVVRSLDRMEKK